MSNKLNTVEIGDEFESKSYEIIKDLLQTSRLGILANYARIYCKKGYYSHLRKKDIIFDLTIELWLPNADRYSILYIIECKNYSKRVPAKQVEDFHSKIQQVSGVNVKGIFITNSPLQEAGYNFAESTGMMLIQADSSEDYKIILHRTTNYEVKNTIPLMTESVDINLINDDIKFVEKEIDEKILGVFKSAAINSAGYGIKSLSQKDIEVIAENELEKIDTEILSKAHGLEVEKLISYLKNEYEIEIIEIEAASELLGFCNLNNNTIGINENIKGTQRELFVLAHEFGHYILHQKLTINQKNYDAFDDSTYNFRTGTRDLKNPRNWIEWQANCFASSLVLPKNQLYFTLKRFQRFKNLTEGVITFSDDFNSITEFRSLISMLANHFNVSQISVEYKLNDLNLVKNYSKLKTVGKIISDNRQQLYL
jgi:Zn-dependent peptidase ImmA (M78 family)